jgi:hypothetical protein
MRKLKISRTDFELAFNLDSYETTAYVNTKTGGVIFIEDYVMDPLEELLTDEETLEDIQAALQAQTDLSDTDREKRRMLDWFTSEVIEPEFE